LKRKDLSSLFVGPLIEALSREFWEKGRFLTYLKGLCKRCRLLSLIDRAGIPAGMILDF
jgi:hypothetical protein